MVLKPQNILICEPELPCRKKKNQNGRKIWRLLPNIKSCLKILERFEPCFLQTKISHLIKFLRKKPCLQCARFCRSMLSNCAQYLTLEEFVSKNTAIKFLK